MEMQFFLILSCQVLLLWLKCTAAADHFNAHYSEAIRLVTAGDYSSSIKKLQYATSLQPNHVDALQLLGKLYIMLL